MTPRLRSRAVRRRVVPGLRLQNRRGAMVLFIGVFFTSTVLLGALTFDFSRLANLKAELQISADAAAHAAIAKRVQSGCDNQPEYDALRAEAQTFALANLAMQGAVTVVTRQLGNWTPVFNFFTNHSSCVPGTGITATDAIIVIVSRQSAGLFMSLVGVAPPIVQARAMAYMCRGGLPSPFPPCASTKAIIIQ